MLKTITAAVLLLNSFHLFSQAPPDTIEVRKSFWGTTFRHNGKTLRPRDLLDITVADPKAYEEMRIAKRNYDVGYAFNFAGGFFLGWPLGTAVGGGEPEWGLAGVGFGLTMVSIPFYQAFVKHTTKAVRIYNAGVAPKNTEAVKVTASTVPKIEIHTMDSLNNLYRQPSDSSYQKYATRLDSMLKHDKKIISYKLCEHNYGNGKIKSRGFEAKHLYGVNEDYTYKIGTWEYYAKDGSLEKAVKYDLRSNVVNP